MSMLNKQLLSKIFFIALILFVAVLINSERSMANPKSTLIKLDLSGHKMNFSSPVNYSKDFPLPSETQYRINIYDNDIYKNPYTDLENSYSIRQSYWDYGRGIIFGGVKGTLSMGMALNKTSDKSLNLEKSDDFITAMQNDFEIIYDEQAREEFVVKLPEKYLIKKISNLDWGYYEYEMGRGEKHVAFSIPVSEQHYLMVVFNFINNSHGKENNWKEQAQETIDFIISSFDVD